MEPHAAETGPFDELAEAFLATLGGKSPRTFTTYRTGLSRFREHLVARGVLETWQPGQVGPRLLEEFYTWLVRRYGRERRATVATHSSALRAFTRYLARRGLLTSGVTY